MIEFEESEKLIQAKRGIAENAIKALLYEVTVSPKPGLVDPISSGPHPDMTVYTFINSAVSLMPYFESCVAAGWNFSDVDLTLLFRETRPLGVEAEKRMFEATKGVNTHKGAVFSLGVLVAAEAYVKNHQGRELFSTIQSMLIGLVAADFAQVQKKIGSELTAGEKQYLKYGITGIRGEAEAGYPSVQTIGLPRLSASQGTLNERLLDTLMDIVGHTEDSNLIKRAGNAEIVSWAHQKSQRYFELGGSRTSEGMAYLAELNQEFFSRNLSLGGSADLLIVTIYIGLENGMI